MITIINLPYVVKLRYKCSNLVSGDAFWQYWFAFCLNSWFALCRQLEEQLSRVQREKNDLQSRMEEDQEDLNELMKKHKAAVAQVCSFTCRDLKPTTRLSCSADFSPKSNQIKSNHFYIFHIYELNTEIQHHIDTK